MVSSVSRQTIIETMKIANFIKHSEVDSFALKHELETVAGSRDISIANRTNRIIKYLIDKDTSESLVENIIIEIINREVERLPYTNDFYIENDNCFEEAYSELYRLLRKDGFVFAGNKLVRNKEMLIETPKLIYNFEFVNNCLDQCQTLIDNHTYGSAVDRAHSALHGYVKYICKTSNLTLEKTDPRLQEYWSKIRREHPKFVTVTGYDSSISDVVNTITKVFEKLNLIRNDNTFSHPNDEIIDEIAAKLMINLSRAILLYIDSKVSST